LGWKIKLKSKIGGKMHSQTINGIPVITFESQDSSTDNFCQLIEGVLGQSKQAIFNFINVTPDWPLDRLFIAIKCWRIKNVNMAIINLSESVVRKMSGFVAYSFVGLVEAMHFLAKKNLIKCCQCGAWLPFTLTAVSLGEKQRWYKVCVYPSCGLLYTKNGQPVIYNDSQVFLIHNQIVCK